VPRQEDNPSETAAAAVVVADNPARKRTGVERTKTRARVGDTQGKRGAVVWIVAGAIGLFVVGGGMLGIAAFLILKPAKPTTEFLAFSEPAKTPTPEVQRPGASDTRTFFS
jgi:hypothetical protein